MRKRLDDRHCVLLKKSVSQGMRTRLTAPGDGPQGKAITGRRERAGFYSRASRAGAATGSVVGDCSQTQPECARAVVTPPQTQAAAPGAPELIQRVRPRARQHQGDDAARQQRAGVPGGGAGRRRGRVGAGSLLRDCRQKARPERAAPQPAFNTLRRARTFCQSTALGIVIAMVCIHRSSQPWRSCKRSIALARSRATAGP